MKVTQIMGWYGVFAILSAYALNRFGIISAHDSFLYQILNLTGSFGIVVSSYARRDFQPVILNIVWLLIALIGLAKVLL